MNKKSDSWKNFEHRIACSNDIPKIQELMATLSGKLLYETQGYQLIEEILYKTETNQTVPLIRMGKNI